MNRFFRTVFSTTIVYLCLTLFGVLITREGIPFLAFSCLYFGLLLFLLPGISQRLAGKERLFEGIGALTAVLGFVPIALMRCPMLHWLIHLAGIAAAAAFLSILRHATTHGIFKAKFEFTVAALAIFIGLVYLVMRTVLYQRGQPTARYEAVSLAMNGVVPYAIVLLATGVLLLRGLRAQPGRVNEQAFNRRQLRDTLIFFLLVTIIFAVDPFVWLGNALFFLLNEVLRPAFRFLAQLFVTVVRSITLWKQPTEDPQPTEDAGGPRPMQAAEQAEAEAAQSMEEYDSQLPIDYIVLAVVVLILLYILAVQISKLAGNLRKRSRNLGSGYPNETCETLPMQDGTGRQGKPKKRARDPRERIRYLYGDFLRFLHQRRVRIGQSDTCDEIRHAAEKRAVAQPSTLSDLTALYEKARYRMQEAPTEADARGMKDLLDRIKKWP